MGYRVVPHTGDYQIEVAGQTLAELFSSALAGLSDFLLARVPTENRPATRTVELSADNPTELLINFLSEALALSQTNKEIYTTVEFSKLDERQLSAKLIGCRVDKFDDEIKAVTYHGAQVVKNQAGEWQTGILFDI